MRYIVELILWVWCFWLGITEFITWMDSPTKKERKEAAEMRAKFGLKE